LTFMLTWFILPLLGEYMDAGYRDPKKRLIYSLRSNGRYQLIMLGCTVAGLIYLIIDYGFDFTAIKGLLMALAYVWGLILAIYLAGHGMVAVPRSLFRNVSTGGRLQRLQTRAAKVQEKLDDAILDSDEAAKDRNSKRLSGMD
jgi:LMBR1-like membrane protein